MRTATIVSSASKRAMLICLVATMVTAAEAQDRAALGQLKTSTETGWPGELVNQPPCGTRNYRDTDICRTDGF